MAGLCRQKTFRIVKRDNGCSASHGKQPDETDETSSLRPLIKTLLHKCIGLYRELTAIYSFHF